MSTLDDLYRESVHAWLDERDEPERPSPDEYDDGPSPTYRPPVEIPPPARVSA